MLMGAPHGHGVSFISYEVNYPAINCGASWMGSRICDKDGHDRCGMSNRDIGVI
jgi:hypothetical protein